MKEINVYRDKEGDLTLGVHGRYYPFFYKEVWDASWELHSLSDDPEHYAYMDEEEIAEAFPNGLEEAYVCTLTEGEIMNNV